MKTEKQKMLVGEPYLAWDEELYAERIECRKVLQKLNNSIPDTDEWRSAIDTLIPDSEDAYLEPPFAATTAQTLSWVRTFTPTLTVSC